MTRKPRSKPAKPRQIVLPSNEETKQPITWRLTFGEFELVDALNPSNLV